MEPLLQERHDSAVTGKLIECAHIECTHNSLVPEEMFCKPRIVGCKYSRLAHRNLQLCII